MGSAGFRLRPLAATRPLSVPVIKILSVFNKSIKAASLGDCFSGCSTKPKKYTKPITVIAKVMAIVQATKTIMRACR